MGTGVFRFGRASRSRRSLLAAATLAGALAPLAAAAQGGPAAWRVECTGDGKTLECRSIQLLVRADRTSLIQVAVRYVPESKAASMFILLPFGLNLTEPVQIKVDNAMPERQPIQTCDASGCQITMTASDRLITAMRSGTDLKITVQDTTKKPVEMALPLLGFGIAYDKAK
jgi:invasion protein IalB